MTITPIHCLTMLKHAQVLAATLEQLQDSTLDSAADMLISYSASKGISIGEAGQALAQLTKSKAKQAKQNKHDREQALQAMQASKRKAAACFDQCSGKSRQKRVRRAKVHINALQQGAVVAAIAAVSTSSADGASDSATADATADAAGSSCSADVEQQQI
jgi:hypothetical protein